MADVLLRELTNTDLDWLVTTGQHDTVSAEQVMLRPNDPWDAIYVLLEGGVTLFQGDSGDRPLTTINRGEIFGEAPLFDLPSLGMVKAVQPSQVITIPKGLLTTKLAEDMTFAAHFYRAIAVMLSERLRSMFEMSDKLNLGKAHAVKEALFIFSELRDSDVDWLISAGKVEKLSADRVLLQVGRPVDALHLVLDGRFSIAVPDSYCNPLSMCFISLEKRSRNYQVFAEISKGGLPGIISFLDSRPMPVTIRSLGDSLVFTIPRSAMTVKLQTDMGFASRFYRVIAVQISELLQTVMEQLVGGSTATQGSNGGVQAMSNVMDDDELDLDDLQQVSQGAARFNWMLEQLGL
ncbi:MAG: cyclic nucleotide-binding domain-containing protein [Cyanobacteria bacterium P01_A01_bin.123]